jgi:hypothetical protein
MNHSGATLKLDTTSVSSLLKSRKERNTRANIRHNAILKSRSTALLSFSSPPKPNSSASNRVAGAAVEQSKSSPSSPRQQFPSSSPRVASVVSGGGGSSSSSSVRSPRRHSSSSKRSLKAALSSDGTWPLSLTLGNNRMDHNADA